MSTVRPDYQMASLYVGDLHPDISEAVLFDKFTLAGPILSIRICRDINTRRSLGYAYVNYQTMADAERALDMLNYEIIRNQPIRMMWADRDPTKRRSGVGNIFLKDLQKEIDTKTLFDTFSDFGNIISCKVATDDRGNSKGFGFINFDTEDAASNAIARVNGKLLNGKKVYVGKFIPRHERERDLGERQSMFTNVYVKNLAEDIDDAKLKTMFERFGHITSCKVMCMDDGKSRGFGFVNFSTAEAAQAAVEALHDQKVNETNNLYLSRAQSKFEREQELRRKSDNIKRQRNEAAQNVNLYVKNLDDTFDDEHLRQLFADYGTITSARVMTDEQRRSRGFGFVCFSAPNEAMCAVTGLNGRIICSKRLYVSLAQLKEERHASLVARYTASGYRQTATPLGHVYQPNAAGNFHMPLEHQRGPTPMRNPLCWTPQLQAGPQANAYPSVSCRIPTYQQSRAGSVRMQPQVYTPPTNVMPSGNARVFNGPAKYMQRPDDGASPMAAGGNSSQQYATSYNANTRNPRAQQQMIRTPPPAAATQQQKDDGGLIAELLQKAKPQEQKQILGERLYPLIERMHPSLAGKITGMLLEIDNSELLHMIVDKEALQSKVQEAIAVLQVQRFNDRTNR